MHLCLVTFFTWVRSCFTQASAISWRIHYFALAYYLKMLYSRLLIYCFSDSVTAFNVPRNRPSSIHKVDVVSESKYKYLPVSGNEIKVVF